MNSSLRLAELVGGLTLAADYANGYPPEKCLRTAILAVAIGQRAGLGEAALRDGYYVSLLRFLGCTAFAHEEAHLYGAGNDLSVRNTMGMADVTNPIGTLRRIVKNVGRGGNGGPIERTKAIARLMFDGDAMSRHSQSQCDVSVRLAEIVGISDDVRFALKQSCERFDGKGAPNHVSGEALRIATRLLHIGDILELAFDRGGIELAREELRLRDGKQLDPVLVKAAMSDLDALGAMISGTSVWDRFLEAEPGTPAIHHDATDVAVAFAHFADLKSVFTLGHSTHVAEIAVRGGRAMGLGDAAIADLRCAALLHDVGRVAVPNGIWDKPAALGPSEWERVRLHAYYTERIALRAPAWSRAARIAAGAHERPDASGYHRGVPIDVLSVEERILAAADVFAALLEPRPHRDAFTLANAKEVLREEVKARRLDGSCVDALLAERSTSTKKQTSPCGLSDREIEVLRHLARGKTNREIGQLLGISPRTVQNHVAHIYDKAGVYSRAGASLFATEQGILRDD